MTNEKGERKNMKEKGEHEMAQVVEGRVRYIPLLGREALYNLEEVVVRANLQKSNM